MKTSVFYSLVVGIIAVIAVAILISSYDRKLEKFEEKITGLEQQLDECNNGAEKLHAKIKLEFERKNYVASKGIYIEMEKRHPDSPLFSEVRQIYDKIIATEKKQEKERLAKIEREKKERLKSLKRLKKDHDDVSNITWYKQPYYTHYANTNLLSVYIGKSQTNVWLRLKISYSGDDWLFFESVYLSHDGNTKQVFFDRYQNKKTDNSGGGVWEWIDISVEEDMESYLREFADAKKPKIRLVGKYNKTRNLTYNERRGLQNVLKGYDALNAEMGR